jgi:hypothetical protein
MNSSATPSATCASRDGEALRVASAYHRAWRERDFAAAAELLSAELEVDVPINNYSSKDEFLVAARMTRQMATHVQVLAEYGDATGAVLIYDLSLPFGVLRVAEQFRVTAGQITMIRHIHDTAAVRAAGLGD